jgi:hypothetical protein
MSQPIDLDAMLLGLAELDAAAASLPRSRFDDLRVLIAELRASRKVVEAAHRVMDESGYNARTGEDLSYRSDFPDAYPLLDAALAELEAAE